MKSIFEGLKILGAYEGANICAEHDIIYAGPDPEEVSAKDKETLEGLGWFIESDSWAHFT